MKVPWKERFPELSGSDETLEELLLSGKIPEESYIQWASEYYKIPSVDNVFFAQLKNFNVLKDNPSGEWSNSFFPIHEWQGMLYIACLAPRDIILTKKHCFVLGSLKSMNALWTQMKNHASAPAVTVSKPAINTPGAKTAAPPAPVQRPAGTSDGHTVTHTKTHSAPPKAPTTPPPPPSSATVAAKKQEAAPAWLPETPAAPNRASGTQDDIDQAADPFSASVIIPLGQLEKMEELSRTIRLNDNQNAKKPGVQSPDPAKKDNSQSKININPSQNSFISEITNVFKMTSTPREASFTTTKTIMPFPDSTKDFTFIRTVYSEQVIVEAHGKVHDNKDPQEALISAFKVLKDYYKKIMWVVRDQKGRAFPIACNDSWSFSDEAWNTPINFKDANPFRLAKFTQKPYHGPVYKSPVNDYYFQLWNGGKYPDVLTIIPVKMGGKVFGYFVGCEKGTHYHPQQTLEIMESVCKELVDTFVRIHRELGAKKSA